MLCRPHGCVLLPGGVGWGGWRSQRAVLLFSASVLRGGAGLSVRAVGAIFGWPTAVKTSSGDDSSLSFAGLGQGIG